MTVVRFHKCEWCDRCVSCLQVYIQGAWVDVIVLCSLRHLQVHVSEDEVGCSVCLWCYLKRFFVTEASFQQHVAHLHGMPYVERTQVLRMLKLWYEYVDKIQTRT